MILILILLVYAKHVLANRKQLVTCIGNTLNANRGANNPNLILKEVIIITKKKTTTTKNTTKTSKSTNTLTRRDEQKKELRDKLNSKQICFCHNYILDSSTAVEAYLTAYPRSII